MCGVRKSKASLSRPAESFAKVRVDLPRLFGGPVCPGFEGREGEGRRERCHLRFQLVSCGRQSRLPKLSSEIPRAPEPSLSDRWSRPSGRMLHRISVVDAEVRRLLLGAREGLTIPDVAACL